MVAAHTATGSSPGGFPQCPTPELDITYYNTANEFSRMFFFMYNGHITAYVIRYVKYNSYIRNAFVLIESVDIVLFQQILYGSNPRTYALTIHFMR